MYAKFDQNIPGGSRVMKISNNWSFIPKVLILLFMAVSLGCTSTGRALSHAAIKLHIQIRCENVLYKGVNSLILYK